VWAIPGSSQTVALPVRVTGEDIKPLTTAEVSKSSLRLDEILQAARNNASALLASLKPTLVRDDRGVIRYAVLQSDDPHLAACIFAPEFADSFLETIGPDVLIAIPNRNRIYIFPRSSVPGAEISEQVFVDYRSTNYPVSREVFEKRAGVLTAVGTLR
ncbi:MAG: hypothetical protein WEB60_13855, partial [Terrimicrobiaceae bacterium]